MNALPDDQTHELKNVDELLDLLKSNRDDAIATNRRFNDRTIVLLTGTVAAFGLVLKYSEAAYGPVQKVLFAISIACFVAAFVLGLLCLRPAQIDFPGTSNFEAAWNGFVKHKSELQGKKEFVKSYCAAVASEMRAGQRLSRLFQPFLLACGGSIVFLAIAELLS